MIDIFIINENRGSALLYGVGTYIREITNMMLSLKYNVSIVTLNSNNVEFEVEVNNTVTKIDIPKFKGAYSIYKYYESVIRLIESYSKNVTESLFLFNYNTHFAIAELLRKKYSNIKIIYTIHYACWNLYETDVNALTEKNNLLRMIELSDGVICLSEDSKNELSDRFDIKQDKLHLISNAIFDVYRAYKLPEKLDVKSASYVKHNEKIILCVGRLEIMKGVTSLIRSFNSVLKEYEDVRLVIVGDGSFSEISGNIGSSASKIIFTGRISQEEIIKWYSIADVGVMPSYSEECSFVGIEMMMHGLPIISTNGRGVRNMFHHMKNCLSVDCQSGQEVFENELSETIIRLLDSETLCNELRQKSRQWYLDNYQLKFMQQKYLSLIEDITK